MKRDRCERCGTPKRRWRRCEDCPIPTRYRRGEDPLRVVALKARLQAGRVAFRADQRLSVLRNDYRMLKQRHDELSQKWEIFRRELGRLLSDWVGWPPSVVKVRYLPRRWRIAYQSFSVRDAAPQQVMVPADLNTFDLQELRVLLYRNDGPRPGVHIKLEATEEERVGYYLDVTERIGDYAYEYALRKMVNLINEKRMG